MRPRAAKRTWLLAGAALVAAIGIAGAVAGARDEGEESPAAPAARVPAAAPAAAAPAQATREEQRVVTAPLPEQAAEALGAALAARQGRAAAVGQALEAARAGRLDGAGLRRQLRQLSGGHPELGPGLLDALTAERSPPIALGLAQALAGLEDDAELRGRTIEALRAAPEAREVGLLALQGRDDPQALRLAADTLAQGSAEARATAAFVLNRAPSPPPQDALETAREALADERAGARLREEAATLLGRPGAPDGDLALLERLVFEGEPAVRMRALAAIEAASGEREPLAGVVDRVLRDSAAPQRLQEMARAWRGAHR